MPEHARVQRRASAHLAGLSHVARVRTCLARRDAWGPLRLNPLGQLEGVKDRSVVTADRCGHSALSEQSGEAPLSAEDIIDLVGRTASAFHIGLDVHKITIAVAVFRPNTTNAEKRTYLKAGPGPTKMWVRIPRNQHDRTPYPCVARLHYLKSEDHAEPAVLTSHPISNCFGITCERSESGGRRG